LGRTTVVALAFTAVGTAVLWVSDLVPDWLAPLPGAVVTAALVERTAAFLRRRTPGGDPVDFHVALSDVRHNKYAALNGTASVTRDRTEIERLWNPGAAAFFEGKDDPNLAVLHFNVNDGQYWDSPSGRLGSLIAMVKAAVGGDDAAGEQGRIASS
jgi:hypothetical protein